MGEHLLGIEGGGTRTTAWVVDEGRRVVRQVVAGPCNLRLRTDDQLLEHFQGLAARLPDVRAIGVGLAGCRDAADRARVGRILEAVWPGVPHRVDHDLETAWLAAFTTTSRREAAPVRVVVVAGTGSCCYGKGAGGRVAKVGGWGHLLGDHGSAHDVAFTALRAVVAAHERTGRWPRLGSRILRRLQRNVPDDLIPWVQAADKTAVAALAPEVFQAAEEGDRLAREVLSRTQVELSAQAHQAARRLGARPSRGTDAEFVLCGPLFTRQPAAARAFGRRLRQGLPGARVRILAEESVLGAVALAREALQEAAAPEAPKGARPIPAPACFIPRSRQLSPTEGRNPRSARLDQLSVDQAIRLMLDEDARIPEVIRGQAAVLGRLVRRTAQAFRQGGRLFYVGAGTSGRLGVLDASECPPTFRSPPEQVQGIMAGGERALHSAVEGAEDDPTAGAEAIAARGVDPRDVVVGIATSGRTPFVWGALAEARSRRATTALLCCNPHLELPRAHRPDLVLALDVGPEVLTGSTRLKAGTVTKLALNILTTLAMVQAGKVIGNLMVDLNPSNEKLRDRAARIVVELTGASYDDAWAACERAGWKVGDAVRQVRRRRRS